MNVSVTQHASEYSELAAQSCRSQSSTSDNSEAVSSTPPTITGYEVACGATARPQVTGSSTQARRRTQDQFPRRANRTPVPNPRRHSPLRVPTPTAPNTPGPHRATLPRPRRRTNTHPPMGLATLDANSPSRHSQPHTTPRGEGRPRWGSRTWPKHAPAARSHPARKAAQAPDELG